jgi:glycosyltransferase involved in cell wall biosynthesis
MNQPLVSIIIPVYNAGEFLAEAIRSVIGQTYPNLELIIVDDCSTENTENRVKQFDDSRIVYLRHERNMGPDVARLTGIHASHGEIIAFLDQDDYFHPEKIMAHIKFREKQPDISLTYNPRFNLDYSATTIRDLVRPPKSVSLLDITHGFPIVPSEIVISREWALRKDLRPDRQIMNGGEYIFLGRLFLGGCKFSSVGRVLNFRRHHSGRVMSRLSDRCKDELYAQDVIFSDPRCPHDVRITKPFAFSNTYLVWSYQAMVQNEIELGQSFFQEAVRLNPSIVKGSPCRIVEFLVMNSIADHLLDHSILLDQVFRNLPDGYNRVLDQYDQAIAMGNFFKEIRKIIWERKSTTHNVSGNASQYKRYINKLVLNKVIHQVLDYEIEFGSIASKEIIKDILLFLEKNLGKSSIRYIESQLAFNRASMSLCIGEYSLVPSYMLRAIINDPRYTINRGTWSIFMRSFINRLPMKSKKTCQV